MAANEDKIRRIRIELEAVGPLIASKTQSIELDERLAIPRSKPNIVHVRLSPNKIPQTRERRRERLGNQESDGATP